MTTSLLIATPSHDGKLHCGFVTSLIGAISRLSTAGINSSFMCIQHTGIAMARNKICNEFLKNTNFSHLLMIDSDQTFKIDLPLQLLQYNMPVIGCAIRQKIDEIKFNVRHFEDGIKISEEHPHMIQVRAVGTGMMLLQRKLLQGLLDDGIVKYAVAKSDEIMPVFFAEGIAPWKDGKDAWLSEDINFCEMLYKKDIPVWLFADTAIGHIGQQTYIANYADELAKELQPLSDKPINFKYKSPE